MLAVLSPAKRLVEGPAIADLPATQPELLGQAERLVAVARDLDEGDLIDLMGISEKLAELNVARFQDFSTPFTPDNARQAARLFAGDTYLGLRAEDLSADDLTWAQDHVAILSGLYGVVRPLDLIQPYRLEMGTKLSNPEGDDLYAFWGSRIASVLKKRLASHRDPVLVNLASKEYASAIDRDALGVEVIEPIFQDVKGGKARVLGMFAKKARGAMARWIVEHRVETREQLKAFDGEGYTFQPELSDDHRWVFQRPQPPPVR